MPTRGECPLKPSPRPAATAALLIRSEIWFGLSSNTRCTAGAPLRSDARAAMVCGDTNTTAPSPSGSVFERRISSRPLPSGTVSMSLQVSAAHSETLSIASRMSLTSAMSTLPLLAAACALSRLPFFPIRGRQAVAAIASSASAVRPLACF